MTRLRTTLVAVGIGTALIATGAVVATSALATPSPVAAVAELAPDPMAAGVGTTADTVAGPPRHGRPPRRGPRLVEQAHRRTAQLPAGREDHEAGRPARRRRARGPARQGRGRRRDL